MKFSIIVPVFNASKYLRECLDSLANQVFQDYEVIVVDDGSTDNSYKIASEYKKKYSNFVVTRQVNGGPLSARLRGYQLSAGDYIIHVDSDDALRSDALEILAREINESHPDVIAYEASRNLDFSPTTRYFPYCEKKKFDDSSIDDLVDLALNTYALNSLCSKAIKREILVNLKLPNGISDLSFAEDFLVSMLVILELHSLIYLPDYLYFYRPNPAGTTGLVTRKVIEDSRIVDYEFCAICKAWEIKRGVKLNWTQKAARSLRTFYTYFGSVCCQWRMTDALDELRRLSSDEWFKKYANNHSAMSLMRFDKRIVLSLVASEHFFCAWALLRSLRSLRNIKLN